MARPDGESGSLATRSPTASGASGPEVGSDAQFEAAGFAQEDLRRVGLQRFRCRRGDLLHQLAGVARIDRPAAELGERLRIAGPPERLPDAGIVTDAADRRHDEGMTLVAQRAERDLDHHLAAVTPLRHQVHLLAHGARPRVLRVGLAVGRVARPGGVGHQRVHRQADQFGGRIAQQCDRRRIGKHDHALHVDQQQCVRIGGEQRSKDRTLLGGRNARARFH